MCSGGVGFQHHALIHMNIWQNHPLEDGVDEVYNTHVPPRGTQLRAGAVVTSPDFLANKMATVALIVMPLYHCGGHGHTVIVHWCL
jgi:hypothetical protein